MPTGIVGPVVVASAALFAVGRLQQALRRNERYGFTTWRWGKFAAGLMLFGLIIKLTVTASLAR